MRYSRLNRRLGIPDHAFVLGIQVQEKELFWIVNRGDSELVFWQNWDFFWFTEFSKCQSGKGTFMILHVHLPIEPHSTKVLVLYRMWWINGNGCRKLLSFPISVPREWKPPCMPCLLVAITLETLFPAVGEHYFLRHLRSIPMAQLERVINSPIFGKHHCWLQYFPWFLWWHFSTSFLMSSREIVLWTQTPARREIRCGDATGILVMIDDIDALMAEMQRKNERLA